MIFSCDKDTLTNAINTVSKALPSKSVNPVCEGILFRSVVGEVILTATDSALTIQTKIAADIKEEGELVLNGKFFAEVVRKMPDGMIEIKGDFREGITVEGNNAKMKISALDADEYPALPVIDRDSFFTVRQSELKKMINQTMFATATDDSRPILTGCLFEIEKDFMRAVALDGYRLALRNSVADEVEEPTQAVIPARALSEITKIANDSDEPARIYIQRSYCMFEIEETKVMTRLIDGEFVKYKPIIPQKLENELTVNRLDLLEAIERAWLIVKENTRNNYIVFRFKDKKFIITSRSDTGNAYEEVSYSGMITDMEIGFNPRYFVDCLKNTEDEYISFSYTAPTSPALIMPSAGDKYLYLILPVRL